MTSLRSLLNQAKNWNVRHVKNPHVKSKLTKYPFKHLVSKEGNERAVRTLKSHFETTFVKTSSVQVKFSLHSTYFSPFLYSSYNYIYIHEHVHTYTLIDHSLSLSLSLSSLFSTSLRRYYDKQQVPSEITRDLFNVQSISLKDETNRLGLTSFKALGGSLVVSDLADREIKPTIVTASAGNHGVGVAFSAQKFDCPCIVYLPESVPESQADRVRAYVTIPNHTITQTHTHTHTHTDTVQR